MDVTVLGPLEVRTDGRAVPVTGGRRRALLAALLAGARRTVSTGDLLAAVWPDGPPPSAEHTLHTHVSRLRLSYGLPITARDGGYVLDLAPEALDAAVFDEHVARAGTAPPADAVPLLRAALALWRGPAYGSAADVPGVRAEAQRLEERRRQAGERLVDALVLTGRPDDAVAVAQAAVGENPTRETAWVGLLRALVAAGRPAEATQAYHRAAAALDTIGLLPSHDLRAAHAAALAPDTTRTARLPPPAPTSPTPAPPTPAPPAPRARDVPEVPRPASSLVGREADTLAVSALLDDTRLVTLVGPGGVGKTRLALEVLHRRAGRHEGIRAAELTTLADPSDVPQAVATALGVRSDGGPPEAALRRAGALDLLVLLDNCEHVVDVAAEVAEHLLAGGRARIIATSRERLGVPGEHVVRVQPLATDGPEPVARRLFLDRAAAAGLGLAAGDLDPALVARAVHLLDGLPLAIEMAAARTVALGLPELVDALDAGLPTTAATMQHPHRHGPERHRTLRAVISWSEALLGPAERRALERWPVFVGPVTAQDARAVLDVTPDTVEALVGHSLLLAQPSGAATRYRMLHTVRSAVLAGTRGEDLRALRRRHAEHVLAVAVAADAALRTAAEPAAVARLTGLTAELRSAHAWARSHDPALAARLSIALHAFAMCTVAEEVFDWAAQLAAPGSTGEDVAAVADLALAARLTLAGDLDAARSRARRSFERTTDARVRLPALELLTDTALYDGRLPDALDSAAQLQALAAQTADAHYLAMAVSSTALAHAYGGDVAAATRTLEVGAPSVASVAGSPSPSDEGWLAYAAGEVAAEGDPASAVRHLDRAIALADTAGDAYLGGVARVSATSVRARSGRPRGELEAFADVTGWWLARGDTPHLVTTLRNLLDVLVALGADEAAAELWGAVGDDRLARTYGPERERLARARDVLGSRVPADVLGDRLAAGAVRDAADAARTALAALADLRRG